MTNNTTTACNSNSNTNEMNDDSTQYDADKFTIEPKITETNVSSDCSQNEVTSEIQSKLIDYNHPNQEESTPDTTTVSTKIDSSNLIPKAIRFLNHPSIQSLPWVEKQSFLKMKGLSDEEINECLRTHQQYNTLLHDGGFGNNSNVLLDHTWNHSESATRTMNNNNSNSNHNTGTQHQQDQYHPISHHQSNSTTNSIEPILFNSRHHHQPSPEPLPNPIVPMTIGGMITLFGLATVRWLNGADFMLFPSSSSLSNNAENPSDCNQVNTLNGIYNENTNNNDDSEQKATIIQDDDKLDYSVLNTLELEQCRHHNLSSSSVHFNNKDYHHHYDNQETNTTNGNTEISSSTNHHFQNNKLYDNDSHNNDTTMKNLTNEIKQLSTTLEKYIDVQERRHKQYSDEKGKIVTDQVMDLLKKKKNEQLIEERSEQPHESNIKRYMANNGTTKTNVTSSSLPKNNEQEGTVKIESILLLMQLVEYKSSLNSIKNDIIHKLLSMPTDHKSNTVALHEERIDNEKHNNNGIHNHDHDISFGSSTSSPVKATTIVDATAAIFYPQEPFNPNNNLPSSSLLLLLDDLSNQMDKVSNLLQNIESKLILSNPSWRRELTPDCEDDILDDQQITEHSNFNEEGNNVFCNSERHTEPNKVEFKPVKDNDVIDVTTKNDASTIDSESSNKSSVEDVEKQKIGSDPLSNALRNMIKNNTRDEIKSCAPMLYLYITNLSSNLSNLNSIPTRYKKIFKNNKSFKNTVGSVTGALDVLLAVGFVDQGSTLEWKGDVFIDDPIDSTNGNGLFELVGVAGDDCSNSEIQVALMNLLKEAAAALDLLKSGTSYEQLKMENNKDEDNISHIHSKCLREVSESPPPPPPPLDCGIVTYPDDQEEAIFKTPDLRGNLFSPPCIKKHPTEFPL